MELLSHEYSLVSALSFHYSLISLLSHFTALSFHCSLISLLAWNCSHRMLGSTWLHVASLGSTVGGGRASHGLCHGRRFFKNAAMSAPHRHTPEVELNRGLTLYAREREGNGREGGEGGRERGLTEGPVLVKVSAHALNDKEAADPQLQPRHCDEHCIPQGGRCEHKQHHT